MTKIINQQLIIIVVTFLAILFGLFFGIAKPRFSTFQARYRSLSESQQKLALLISRKENLIKLKKDESKIEEMLKKAQNLIPDKKQTSDFIVQLEAGSIQTGNVLKSIRLEEAYKKTNTPKEEEESKTETQIEENNQIKEQQGTIRVSIELVGTFHQLLNFLTLSESLSRFISFPTLTITNTKDNILNTKLEGEIYYRK